MNTNLNLHRLSTRSTRGLLGQLVSLADELRAQPTLGPESKREALREREHLIQWELRRRRPDHEQSVHRANGELRSDWVEESDIDYQNAGQGR